MKLFYGFLITFLANLAQAETRDVLLESADKTRIKVATLKLAEDRSYSITMADTPFSDHFLSMRPFRCLEGPKKHWCHVPYPYEIARNVSADLTDLEYDFLFVWKDSTEYGINMWNGVYYKLEEAADGQLVGILHEIDMGVLAVPPSEGDLRPVTQKHLFEGDPDSHWLPRMIVE